MHANNSSAARDVMNRKLIDAELVRFDEHIQVDQAHVIMLAETGLIERADASALLRALAALDKTQVQAALMESSAESLFFAVEQMLTDRVGAETAGRLQLARSRLDQSAAINRLYLRNQLLEVLDLLQRLMAVVLQRADEWRGVYLAGWTHLQHAQPWSLGHHALAQYGALCRDAARLQQVFIRTNQSALGAGALVGVGWEVDRDRVAVLLGHDGVIGNSMDAANCACDCNVEIASTLALLMANVGRYASDLYLWSSAEFGLIRVADVHCGGSSIMPQKRNPVALISVRALAGSAVSWPGEQLGVLRTSLSTDCDAFYAPDDLERHALDVQQALTLFCEVLEKLEVDSAACAGSLADSWCSSSALADRLTLRRGLDFRRSHHFVSQLIKLLHRRGAGPSELTIGDLHAAAELAHISYADILSIEECLEALSSAGFAESRRSAGSLNPSHVLAQLEKAGEELSGLRAWCEGWRSRVKEADELRRHAMQALGA